MQTQKVTALEQALIRNSESSRSVLAPAWSGPPCRLSLSSPRRTRLGPPVGPPALTGESKAHRQVASAPPSPPALATGLLE